MLMQMAVAAYHRELTKRLASILGSRLLGVYAGGSYGLGDFDPARSDLDVLAVSREPVSAAEKQAIVARLRHEAMPCPARGLEFVLYPERSARIATAEAGFLLNLNTGPEIGFRVDEQPGEIERHWFPIDRAIARCGGVALQGPPAGALFAPIPRRLLLPAVRESLEWHRQPGHSSGDDTVLNACRALRWLREDVWCSKSSAGAWALEHVDDRELVADALAHRDRMTMLERPRVERFLRGVLAEIGT